MLTTLKGGIVYDGIYIALMLFGILFLVLSAIFGELGDLVGDIFGGTEADGADSDSDQASWLSSYVISVAFIIIGFSGLLASEVVGNEHIAALMSIAIGLFIAELFRRYLLGFVLRQQYSGTRPEGENVGRTGSLSLPASASQPGEVRFVDASGAYVSRIARVLPGSSDLPAGTSVKIIAVQGGDVTVEKYNTHYGQEREN